MADLIVQSGKHKGKRLSIPTRDMIVGRDDDCDLRIASSLVSRKHCVLKATPEGIEVADLGSQNGTYINDVPVNEPTLMREGDILRIGATLLAVPKSQKSKMTLDSHHDNISEAEIADWLTDSMSGADSNFSGTDTAIIGAFPPAALAQTPLPPSNSPTPKPSTSAVRTQATATKSAPAKVLSVKDEAALVIQKHWESVKAKHKS